MIYLTVRALCPRAGAFALALTAVAVFAQETVPAGSSSVVDTHVAPFRLNPKLPGCESDSAESNSFRDRACYQTERLVSPAALLRGIAESGFSQWRNAPYTSHEQPGDFGRRLEYFYARKSARNAGELIAGYLDHEPVRPHTSGQTGFWNRSRAAMLSVVAVNDGSTSRPALAPIAGSFASGFVTLGCCGIRSSPSDALERSGATYATYFLSALFREFKPELKAYALQKLHRSQAKNQTGSPD